MCLQNGVYLRVNYHATGDVHKTVSSHQYKVDLTCD